uniref:hypothetical protein n=1 Tax=Clostridium sp. NkU-1 TaxID=1095009 RepID=UPI0006D01163
MNFKSHKYKGRTVGKIIKVCEHVSWYKFSKRIYYYPIYSYTVEGITYEEKFPFYETSSSILPIGKDNILLYDKKTPGILFLLAKRMSGLNSLLLVFVVFYFGLS